MNPSKRQVQILCITAMLIALGLLVPMISPIKLVMEPMSFTLGAHIAIMTAMFVSPFSAVSVAVGTAAGFYLAGFSIPVVLRSLSHVVWALAGARYLYRHPLLFSSLPKTIVFAVAIALLHALCEVAIVLPFYVGQAANTFVYLLFGLVGVGTIVHSLFDFALSLLMWKVLCHSASLQRLSIVKCVSFKS